MTEDCHLSTNYTVQVSLKMTYLFVMLHSGIEMMCHYFQLNQRHSNSDKIMDCLCFTNVNMMLSVLSTNIHVRIKEVQYSACGIT